MSLFPQRTPWLRPCTIILEWPHSWFPDFFFHSIFILKSRFCSRPEIGKLLLQRQDSQYLRLCGPYGLGCNYSTLAQCESSHRQYFNGHGSIPITLDLQKQVVGPIDYGLPKLALNPCYLKYSQNQQHRHHLGACWKCRLSGPTPELPILNLHFNKTTQVIHTHTKIWKSWNSALKLVNLVFK